MPPHCLIVPSTSASTSLRRDTLHRLSARITFTPAEALVRIDVLLHEFGHAAADFLRMLGWGGQHKVLLILARHGRVCPGHPRLTSFVQEKMPGTRPGMTGYVSGGTRPSVLASRPR